MVKQALRNAAVLLVILYSCSAHAQDKKALSLGLGIGASFGVNEARDKTLHPAGIFSFVYWQGFTPYLTPELSLTFTRNATATTGGKFDYSTTLTAPDFRLRFYPEFIENKWHSPLLPYLHAGIGLVNYNVGYVPPKADPSVPLQGTALFFPIGAGVTYQIEKHWALDLNFSGNISNSDYLSPALDNRNDGWWQGTIAIHYNFTNDSGNDDDHDGLTNEEELRLGTDPHNADTDGDGLSDGDEVHKYHTNPLNADTDGDGLRDGEEVTRYHTDPKLPDTDGDGLKDGEEVLRYHTDPLKADTDGDGLRDGEEVNVYRTDPLNVDTDRDGLSDGEEVTRYKTNPLDPDSDHDGLKDGEEVNRYHTNPLDPDTDKGGVTDGVEVHNGTNPLDRSDDYGKKIVSNQFSTVGSKIVLEGVVFDVNRATIKPESEFTLQKALKTLVDNPLISVEIDGYTDNSGNPVKNQVLSADRASSVKGWLVQHGIAAARMTTRGFGPANPVAPNDTPANKQRNRRIEFTRTR
jgi:outer membrane protein OmpA-like peptidoglycan-associated protein